MHGEELESDDDPEEEVLPRAELLNPAFEAERITRVANNVERMKTALYFAASRPLPNGWTDTEAHTRPLDEAWFSPVVQWMEAQRIDDGNDSTTYISRISILAWSIVTKAKWCQRCRYGTAWRIMLNGLDEHGFEAHGREARLNLHPSPTFFDELGSQQALAEHLKRTYRTRTHPRGL